MPGSTCRSILRRFILNFLTSERGRAGPAHATGWLDVTLFLSDLLRYVNLTIFVGYNSLMFVAG